MVKYRLEWKITKHYSRDVDKNDIQDEMKRIRDEFDDPDLHITTVHVLDEEEGKLFLKSLPDYVQDDIKRR